MAGQSFPPSYRGNGILFLKLFWPTVRKNNVLKVETKFRNLRLKAGNLQKKLEITRFFFSNSKRSLHTIFETECLSTYINIVKMSHLEVIKLPLWVICLANNGILLPKLFWPTVRKNCSSDREKLLKFEAEGQEFVKFLRLLEQFIQTVNAYSIC